MEAQVEQGTKDKPEAAVAEDALWNQAQKDRASTQADGAGPDAGTKQVAVQQGDGKTVDPLAGLPEPTRKLIEQIQAKTVEQDKALKEAGQKLATAHGTIGNLSKKLDDSLVALTQMKPVLDAVQIEAKAKADTASAEREAKRKERRERLADLPDVLEELDDIRADAKPVVKQKPEAEVKPEVKPEAKTQQLPEDREVRLVLERELSDLHPKWIEMVRGKEFKDWHTTQPEAVQALSQSDDIADADKLLTLYKKHKEDAAKVAKVEADRQTRLRRGENVQGSGTAQQGGESSVDALWEKAKRDRAAAKTA